MIGKPEDRNEAIEMLKSLSGHEHYVVTGVCLTTTRKQKAFSVTSTVRFATLTEEEITYYVDDSTELMDFAYTHVALAGACLTIQAYAGIPYDGRELTIKFIYQPTGEVMFDQHISKDNPKASVEEEEFKERLEEMKQGEHK